MLKFAGMFIKTMADYLLTNFCSLNGRNCNSAVQAQRA